MQFCMPHWNALRAEIDQRGLMHLVPKSKEAAIAAIVSEFDDGSNPQNFDPLMFAHWQVISNLLNVSKELLYLEGCPVCIANIVHAEGCAETDCRNSSAYYDAWLGHAANEAKDEWERLSHGQETAQSSAARQDTGADGTG